MVNFSTQIPDCDSYSPALLDLFISSDASICSTMAFPPLGNSDHVVVSVSIDFPSNSQRDAPFHRIAYDYSRADWDGLRDHLRDVPWEDIFKLSASAAASEFCEWVQVGIDAYIPHRKYQVKPHSSPQNLNHFSIINTISWLFLGSKLRYHCVYTLTLFLSLHVVEAMLPITLKVRVGEHLGISTLTNKQSK